MITTKGRYALRVMLDLAQHEGVIPLKDIAQRQDVSKKYLEILMRELVGGGLVQGISGRGGGYRLVRRPEQYTLGEILEKMEGPLAPVACLAGGTVCCPRASECLTLPVWMEYDRMTHDFFYGKTLMDLIRET